MQDFSQIASWLESAMFPTKFVASTNYAAKSWLPAGR
jgi:hypothetical protein